MFNKIKVYIVSILIPVLVGITSALLTKGNMDIYQTINTPPFAPPAILFPIVWTILYVLMGISSAKIILSDNPAKNNANEIYIFSLFINFFWSIIFFNLRAFTFAFVWLILLLLSIIYTIINYYPINKKAALMQIPYLIWVIFAGILNFSIAILN